MAPATCSNSFLRITGPPSPLKSTIWVGASASSGGSRQRCRKTPCPRNLPFKRQFRGMDRAASADRDCFRLKVSQELKDIEVETRPDRFAILLAANDFLNYGKGPNLPKIVTSVGLDTLEADLQRGRMPLPALDDLFLNCFKPVFGHDSLRGFVDPIFFSDFIGPLNCRLFREAGRHRTFDHLRSAFLSVTRGASCSSGCRMPADSRLAGGGDTP